MLLRWSFGIKHNLEKLAEEGPQGGAEASIPSGGRRRLPELNTDHQDEGTPSGFYLVSVT